MQSLRVFPFVAKISQQPSHHANARASGLVWDITRGEEAIPAAVPVSRLLNSSSRGASGRGGRQAGNALARDQMAQKHLYLPGILALKGTLQMGRHSASE